MSAADRQNADRPENHGGIANANHIRKRPAAVSFKICQRGAVKMTTARQQAEASPLRPFLKPESAQWASAL